MGNLNIEDTGEPDRLARHDGMLYYQCELGPVYAVSEGALHEVWRNQLDMRHTDTRVVASVPAGAEPFEVGDAEQLDEPGTVDPGLLTSALGAIDEAIEEWATWCDDKAAGKVSPARRTRVPYRRALAA